MPIKPGNIDIATTLAKSTLFATVDNPTQAIFAAKATVKHFPKGKILFLHKESAECFYIIAEGWIKLFRETLDGDEAVVDVLNKGHLFGETALFAKRRYPYSAQVAEDATLLTVPLALLQQQLEQNHSLAIQMAATASQLRQRQDKELEHRDLQTAPQRIGCFLLRLYNPDMDDPSILHLPYDKTLIASHLGMKAETFSRALACLRKETSIDVYGATVKIANLDQLAHYCCHTCSSSYPCQGL